MRSYLFLFVFLNLLVGQAHASLWLVAQKTPERGGFGTSLYDKIRHFKDAHKKEGIEEYSSAGGQLFPSLVLLDVPTQLEAGLSEAFPANGFLVESFSDIMAAAKGKSSLAFRSVEEATPLISEGSFVSRVNALRGLETVLAKSGVVNVSLESRDKLTEALYKFVGLAVSIYNQRYFRETLILNRQILPKDYSKVTEADYKKVEDELKRPAHQTELRPLRETAIQAMTLISLVPATASEAYLLHSGMSMDFAGYEVLAKDKDVHFSAWLKLVEKSVDYTLESFSSSQNKAGTYCGGSSSSAPPRYIDGEYRNSGVTWRCDDKADPFDINDLPLYPVVFLTGQGAEKRQEALVNLFISAEARQQQAHEAKLAKRIDEVVRSGKKTFADLQKQIGPSTPLTPARYARAEQEFVKSEVEYAKKDFLRDDQMGGQSILDGILYTVGQIPFIPTFQLSAKEGVLSSIALFDAVWDGIPQNQVFPSYRTVVADSAIGMMRTLVLPENKAVMADTEVGAALSDLTSRLRSQYGKYFPKGI